MLGHLLLNPDLIEKSKRIVDMALELETNIVTTHIGVVPSDPSHPRYIQTHVGVGYRMVKV